jgi:hypothetical protein
MEHHDDLRHVPAATSLKPSSRPDGVVVSEPLAQSFLLHPDPPHQPKGWEQDHHCGAGQVARSRPRSHAADVPDRLSPGSRIAAPVLHAAASLAPLWVGPLAKRRCQSDLEAVEDRIEAVLKLVEIVVARFQGMSHHFDEVGVFIRAE